MPNLHQTGLHRPSEANLSAYQLLSKHYFNDFWNFSLSYISLAFGHLGLRELGIPHVFLFVEEDFFFVFLSS